MYFIIVLVIVLLDQISKLAAIKYLKGNRPLVLIEDFFKFTTLKILEQPLVFLKMGDTFYYSFNISHSICSFIYHKVFPLSNLNDENSPICIYWWSNWKSYR